MKEINLRDFYPWYKEDVIIEVTEEVAEELLAGQRYIKASRRRVYRNKAHFSLDAEDGIEYSACFSNPSSQELMERMERFEYLCHALNSLPDAQGQRVFEHYLLGHSVKAIAAAEGVTEQAITAAIRRGLQQLFTISQYWNCCPHFHSLPFSGKRRKMLWNIRYFAPGWPFGFFWTVSSQRTLHIKNSPVPTFRPDQGILIIFYGFYNFYPLCGSAREGLHMQAGFPAEKPAKLTYAPALQAALVIGLSLIFAQNQDDIVFGLHQSLDLGILPLGLNAGDLRFIELGVKARPAYICSGQSLPFGKKGVQVVPLPLQKQDQHHYRQIDPPTPYTLGCVHDCAQSQDNQPQKEQPLTPGGFFPHCPAQRLGHSGQRLVVINRFAGKFHNMLLDCF